MSATADLPWFSPNGWPVGLDDFRDEPLQPDTVEPRPFKVRSVDEMRLDFFLAEGRKPRFSELHHLWLKDEVRAAETDTSIPQADYYRELEKRRKKLATFEAELGLRTTQLTDRSPRPEFFNSDGSIVGLEEYQTDSHVFSNGAQRVNEACASITLFEVYDRLIGKEREAENGRTEGIMAFCPDPSHNDQRRMSAWIGKRDDGEWAICCGHTFEGWDMYGLAGIAWNLDTQTDFWEIKCRLAKELRDVDYERPVRRTPKVHADFTELDPSAPPVKDSFERKVQLKANELRVHEAAREQLRREKDIQTRTPFSLNETLRDLLAEPKRQTDWTIEGLHGLGANSLIIGDLKSGKTTLIQNLLRSLADREPLFDELRVRDISGNIAYFNFEVDSDEMRNRLERLPISNIDRILPKNLRSERYDLLNEETFDETARVLRSREIEVLILDPWSRINLSENENDNAAATRYLQAVDSLKAEAGVVDVFIPAHSMKNADLGAELTVRGASAVDGWADYRWLLYADDRRHYFKQGRSRQNNERLSQLRDVTLGPDGLLKLSQTSVAKASRNALDKKVLDYVGANPGCVKNDIVVALGGTKSRVLKAIDQLHRQFDLAVERTPTGHFCYLPKDAPGGVI